MSSVLVKCSILNEDHVLSSAFPPATTVDQVKRWMCDESPILFSADPSDLVLGMSETEKLYDEGTAFISSSPSIQERYICGEVVQLRLYHRSGAPPMRKPELRRPPQVPNKRATTLLSSQSKALVSFENHATMEGFLTKRGRNVQSWKRRWCILQNNFLLYFSSKNDVSSPLGAVPIQDCYRCSMMDDMAGRSKFTFGLYTRSRTYFMYPDTLKEAQSWVAAVNRCMVQLGVEGGEEKLDGTNVCKEGFMMKRGPQSGWKKRYFLLRDQILYYYKRKGAAAPLGSIPLQDALLIDEPEEGKGSRKGRFHIQTRHRTYHLASLSFKEKQEWLLCIGAGIHNPQPLSAAPTTTTLLEVSASTDFTLDVPESFWEETMTTKVPANAKEVVAAFVEENRLLLDRMAGVVECTTGADLLEPETRQFKLEIARLIERQLRGRMEAKSIEVIETDAPFSESEYPTQFPVYFLLCSRDVKEVSISVSPTMTLDEVVAVLLRKMVASGSLPEEEASTDAFYLKLADTAEYMTNLQSGIMRLVYVRESLKRCKKIRFTLMPRNTKADVGRCLIGSQRGSRAATPTAMETVTCVSQENLLLPFQVRLNPMERLPASAAKNGDVVLECFLAFGAEKLGTIMRTPRRADFMFYEILVAPVNLSELPRETRLCCTLWRKGTTDEPLAFVNIQLYDHAGFMRQGRHRFPMWADSEASAVKTTELSLDPDAPLLVLEFPTFPLPVFHSLAATEPSPPSSEEEPDAETKAELKAIINADPLAWHHMDDKKLLWQHRHYLKRVFPSVLPKVLLSVSWRCPAQVKDAHILLEDWPLLEIAHALELLDINFADRQVRKFALKSLAALSQKQDLNIYLLQMLQAVKYEPYHNSDLVFFLLDRAVRDKRDSGQQFFWQVKSEQDINPDSMRFRLILQAFMLSCGQQLEELIGQVTLIQGLQRIALELKETKPTKRNELLHARLRELEEILPLKMALPINARWHVCGFLVDECKWLDSFTVPLWLVFRSAYSGGRSIKVLFKAGDDLRQDVLTLQMFTIMDELWKQEGIDLHMTPYQCVSTGKEIGMIEVVENARTTADVQKLAGGATKVFAAKTLANWLSDQNNTEEGKKRAEVNFAHSLAGYCVATYVLGIGDRHNDNIMVTSEGHLFHIDFAHFLGNTMKFYGIKRERARFVLTPNFVSVIGGKDSAGWNNFLKLCGRAYNILRKNAHIFMSLFMLMLTSGIPQLTEQADLAYLKESFNLSLSDGEARETFKELAVESLNTKTTQINNFIHILAHTG